ncbi:MAG: hypothetical protein ABI333_03210 [bacterium]
MQPKPLIEETSRQEQPITDLCDACAHGPTCRLSAAPMHPVHECNEYDEYDEGATAAAQGAGRLVAIPELRERGAAGAAALAPGLCGNCDHRETCTLPRSAGGVWHCEEYR